MITTLTLTGTSLSVAPQVIQLTNLAVVASSATGSYTVTQSDVTQHQSALSLTESQISDLQSYLTSYTVSEGDVTAHQSALSIANTQITGLGTAATTDFGDYATAAQGLLAASALQGYTVTESDVTAHQAALTITESQISDLSSAPQGWVQKSASYLITSSDYGIEATANTFALTLPTAVGITGKAYVIKNTGTGVLTLDADGSETIDGALTISLTQYSSLDIVSNGSNWIII